MAEQQLADTTSVDEANRAVGASTPPASSGSTTVPINQPAAPDPATLVTAPVGVAPASTDVADKTPGIEAPILVSESDVKKVTNGSDLHLAEEVETLSGEIQALQAKIDRLTSGTSVSTEKPAEKPAVAAPPKVNSTPPPPVTPIIPTTSKPEGSTAPKPKPSGAIDDIYSKVTDREKEAEDKAASAASTSGAEDISGPGSLATIGEALIVFGLIVFLLMLAVPLLKSLIPASVLPAVKSIGWPASAGALLIGLILMLFTKGKTTTKILAVLLVIFSTVMFLGTGSFSTYLGPLAGMLDSVFSFYR